MSEKYKLPKDWAWCSLEKICNKASSNLSLKSIENEYGIYPIFGAKGFIKNISFFHRDKPYISIIKDGAGVGRIMLLEGKSSIIGTMQYLIPNEMVKIKYLYYILSVIDFSQYISGTTIPHIYYRDYKEHLIPLPPIAEQQRIVTKLDHLFEKIDQAIALHQHNIDRANQLMASTLDQTFKQLEGEYDKYRIADVIELAQYGFSHKAVENGMYPFLRMGNLQGGRVFYDDLKYVDLSDSDFKKYKLEKGDLLFNRTNSFELVGKTAIFEGDMDMTFASYLIRVKVKESRIGSSYLNYFLNSESTQNTLKSMASKAINQSNINAEKLKSITVPLPPLAIQQQTVAYLDSIATKVEAIKALNTQKLADLKALKASILDKAFRGEL